MCVQVCTRPAAQRTWATLLQPPSSPPDEGGKGGELKTGQSEGGKGGGGGGGGRWVGGGEGVGWGGGGPQAEAARRVFLASMIVDVPPGAPRWPCARNPYIKNSAPLGPYSRNMPRALWKEGVPCEFDRRYVAWRP